MLNNYSLAFRSIKSVHLKACLKLPDGTIFFVSDFSREPKAGKLDIDFSASGDLKVGTCLAKAMKPL